MTSPLMISVAGVRGIVGESLTPPVLARFAAAFARGLGDRARSWSAATRGARARWCCAP